MTDQTFRREVRFTPAFDNRDTLRDASKPFGTCRGVEVWFLLHGPDQGCCAFGFSTGWLPTHIGVVTEVPDHDLGSAKFHPSGRDVGYHRKLDASEAVAPLVDVESVAALGDQELTELAESLAGLGMEQPAAMGGWGGTIHRGCELIGGDCVHDGSGVDAQQLLLRLVTDGHEAVWTFLESYYQGRLDEHADVAGGWRAGALDRLDDAPPQVTLDPHNVQEAGPSDAWRAGYLVGYREAPDLSADQLEALRAAYDAQVADTLADIFGVDQGEARQVTQGLAEADPTGEPMHLPPVAEHDGGAATTAQGGETM